MLGVLHLAEASRPFAYLFEKELGLSLDDMRQMSSSGGSLQGANKKAMQKIRRTRDGWGALDDLITSVKPSGDSSTSKRSSGLSILSCAACCGSP
ncbi:hypothetical protein WJX84_003110 [Apatococcus fuscideae]|uniref:Uncharacterized protein n=1 Tax=Apatococcus fuscideae TaxID=2026836 RepID=A0AAW1SQR5_9CHLO